MTKEEIIEMARQAGFVDYELDDGTTNAFDKRYETFAKLVAEHEREACAKVAEERCLNEAFCTPESMYEMLKTNIAKEIRARGQE
jgi:hypothetical protein